MRLRKDISIPALIRGIRKCSGEVYFTTSEGDVLNLRSPLSTYVFMAVISDSTQKNPLNGEIKCQNPEDYDVLQPFLEAN